MVHELLNAYDELLIGKRSSLGNYYFPSDTVGGTNERNVLVLIRYAIEYILGWNIEKSLKKLDAYILRQMKLDKLICYIDYPISVLPGDTRYILSLLYPETVCYPERRQIEHTLETVLTHNLQFPRLFFSGEKGRYRFRECLKFLITHYKSFHSIEEIYDFFTSQESNTFLESFRLRNLAIQYDIDILKLIYEITKNEPHSELYYCFYKFQIMATK